MTTDILTRPDCGGQLRICEDSVNPPLPDELRDLAGAIAGKVEKGNSKSRRRRLRLYREWLLAGRPFCTYCGRKLEPLAATVDHVIPRANGGGTTQRNLTLSCLPCNQVKADRTPTQWARDILLKSLVDLHNANPRCRKCGAETSLDDIDEAPQVVLIGGNAKLWCFDCVRFYGWERGGAA